MNCLIKMHRDFYLVTKLNLLLHHDFLTSAEELWLMKTHCVIWKWGLLQCAHVNDANPEITGTLSKCNYITECWGSPQPKILLRVNPVTFIIRPGGEASSELLWNDAELKSFVFQKMDVDQPQPDLLVPRTSVITAYMLHRLYVCWVIHILCRLFLFFFF